MQKYESRANAEERDGQRSQERTERCREKYMRAMKRPAMKVTMNDGETRQDETTRRGTEKREKATLKRKRKILESKTPQRTNAEARRQRTREAEFKSEDERSDENRRVVGRLFYKRRSEGATRSGDEFW